MAVLPPPGRLCQSYVALPRPLSQEMSVLVTYLSTCRVVLTVI